MYIKLFAKRNVYQHKWTKNHISKKNIFFRRHEYGIFCIVYVVLLNWVSINLVRKLKIIQNTDSVEKYVFSEKIVTIAFSIIIKQEYRCLAYFF